LRGEEMDLEPVDIYGDLKGAIDLHIHTTPDGFPRLLDDFEEIGRAHV
jgi:hypothetical protein